MPAVTETLTSGGAHLSALPWPPSRWTRAQLFVLLYRFSLQLAVPLSTRSHAVSLFKLVEKLMGNVASICGSRSTVADALEMTPRVAAEGSRPPQRSEVSSHPLQAALPSRKDGKGVQGAYSRLRQHVEATQRSTAATRNAIASEADALYQTDNIIGSTGGPGQRPTVYYRTNSGTYGRITQEHPNSDNIGRALPRKSPG
jgi:hypothetical protein